MQTVVMVIEGVLRVQGSDAPIPEGITLYHGLADASRLHLVSALWTPEETNRWIFSKGVAPRHIRHELALTPSPEDRLEALRRIASWSPALVVESDPLCAVEALRAGYPTMLFARPFYRNVQWRPDASRAPQPWDEIAAEMSRQEELRYLDERLR